jgi:hypothetical protein
MSTFRHLDPDARVAKGSPDPSDVYVQRELTDMSVGFMLKPETLVANQVCPSINVKQQGGKYISYPRGFFFRDEMAKRADGSESVGGGFAVDQTPTYFADVWAWHTDIGPQVRANAQIVDIDRAATMLCTNKAMLRREKLWMSTFFTTGVWTTNVAGKTTGGGGVAGTDLGWLDASALPIKQIKAVIRSIQKLHGFKPNHAVFDTKAWDAFCEHPNVLNRINAGQTPGGPAELSKQMVAGWLGLDAVYVTEGVITTSKEGQTDALDFIATAGSGQVLLAYAPPAPGLFVPSAYYFFDWVADGLVGSFGNAVSRWYNQDRKSTRYEIEMATDCKLVSPDMGGFMTNMVV